MRMTNSEFRKFKQKWFGWGVVLAFGISVLVVCVILAVQ